MGRRQDPPITGVLAIDKPAGMTSHDVVARVRRALSMRRVGHAGTLDPMATGVLLVGVGTATRLLGIVGGHDKEYTATIRLGASTSTDDQQGEIVSRCEPGVLAGIDDGAIGSAIGALVGTIRQRPSSVSAVRIDGKRAYERVRSGEQVELPERTVTVAAFDVLGIRRSPDAIDVDVRVECSAGTYIRALARDVGATLGTGGHLTQLRRTRSGGMRVEDCVALEDAGVATMMPAAEFARTQLPVVDIDEDTTTRARHGSTLALQLPDAPAVALIGPGSDLVAVVGPGPRYLAVFPPSTPGT